MKALAVTIIEKYNIKMIYEKSDENYRDKKVTTLGLVAARKGSIGVKGKNLFFPVRTALYGDPKGPDIPLIFSILGRDETLIRLSQVIK